MADLDEASDCPDPECDGTLMFPVAEDCSCHISPPCGACTSVRLTCTDCGWVLPEEPEVAAPTWGPQSNWYKEMMKPKSSDLGGGKRVFDWSCDSRSGSTMVYTGSYEGPVTGADIIALFGDGTFGHRGPTLGNGRFSYTKITD